ncbi:MAG: hypothetical protein P8189_11700 [Anaerolineae bacterium]|jgi:hypothetical protein
MSQDLRDMLANRRFAIPLIILLAFCFVGLILVGVVLILRPGPSDDGEPVAEATLTATFVPTERLTSTPSPTDSPTSRPSPTLVPLGTSTESVSAGTPSSTPSSTPTAESTSTTSPGGEATATPQTEDELAQTGVGWGLVLFSGAGLAVLALVARRLRLAH